MADYPADEMIGQLNPRQIANPGVFTFVVQELTEHAKLTTKSGEASDERDDMEDALALFGAVFQRADETSKQGSRICVGRVEIRASQVANLKIGGFCFSDDTDVQPFLYAKLNVLPSELERLRDMLRTGHDIRLIMRGEAALRLPKLIAEEAELPAQDRGRARPLASVSFDIKR